MNNVDVKRITGDIPHMTFEQAETMTKFIEENRIENILELGFASGVSTCYMAAALARTHVSGGRIVTIDNLGARGYKPCIEELLERVGERDRVTIYYEPTSYNWRLMRFLEQVPQPRFDLCYIDGAHDWCVDGMAFFLVDRLLRPGGWIIFDDLDWTYAGSPKMETLDFVRVKPKEEKTTPHVRKIYELLVRTHPYYDNFMVRRGWAYAQKRTDIKNNMAQPNLVIEHVVEVRREVVPCGFGWFLMCCARKLVGR